MERCHPDRFGQLATRDALAADVDLPIGFAEGLALSAEDREAAYPRDMLCHI
jgi:hypothetical protein